MRNRLIGSALVVAVAGVLMVRVFAEPQGGTQPPAGARRPAQTAPAEPPQFNAEGFAELATRVEQLRKEHEKLLQQRKAETFQFTDCARVGFKLVRADNGGEFSCPANKVVQSIYVGPKSSGVANFRLELDLLCCSVAPRAAASR